MKSFGLSIQLKSTELFFSVVLFIMLYKAVLPFDPQRKILWRGHSNENCRMTSFLCIAYAIVYR